jgi:hypothetical protein
MEIYSICLRFIAIDSIRWGLVSLIDWSIDFHD